MNNHASPAALAAALVLSPCAPGDGPAAAPFSVHVSPRVAAHAAVDGDVLWIGTAFGGVMRWDTTTGDHVQYARVANCMPDDVINDIAVDPLTGDVWVATWRGLGLLPGGGAEGSTWITFDTTNGPFPTSAFLAVAVEGENVWAGTWDSGVWLYEDREQWINFNPANSPLSDELVTSIEVDLDGNKWFGVWGDGVDRFDGTTWTNFRPQGPAGMAGGPDPCGLLGTPPEFLGLISHFVWVLGVDPVSGAVWFRNDDDSECLLNGVTRFDGTSFNTFTTQNSDITSNTVGDVGFDASGNTWLTAGAGVVRFDGTTWTGFPRPATTIDGVGADLWFGTSEGVTRYDGTSFTDFIPRDALAGGPVRDLAATAAGDAVWIATDGGVQRLDDEGFATFDPGNSPLPSADVRAVEVTASGDVWVGMSGGAVARRSGLSWHVYDSAQTGLANVTDIGVDALGRIWAGWEFGGLSIFDGGGWSPAGGPGAGGVRDIELAPNGDLWIAGGGGAARWNGATWTVVGIPQGLPHSTVWDIEIAANGDAYFATHDGLARYDGVEVTVVPVPFTQLRTVAVDAAGTVWVGAWNAGVTRLDPESFTSFFYADGMPDERPYTTLAMPDGRVLFGTEFGLVTFPAPNPADINADGAVNVVDLVAVIVAWGPCPPPPASCPADVDDDGVVGVTDLVAVIEGWG